MKELIKITEHEGRQAVSARELHAFLENKQEFANWMKSRIDKYGLTKGEDYEVFDKIVKNLSGGRPLIEYALTINCAKELSMVEGNAKGRQARRYFIDRDNQLRSIEHGAALPGNIEERLSRLEGNVEESLKRLEENDVRIVNALENVLLTALQRPERKPRQHPVLEKYEAHCRELVLKNFIKQIL